MLLILRHVSAREVEQNPPQSDRTANKKRFEIADTADPKNLQGEYGGGTAASHGGFEIQNSTEKLEKSRIGAANRKTGVTNEAKRLLKTKGNVFPTDFKAKRYLKTKQLFL